MQAHNIYKWDYVNKEDARNLVRDFNGLLTGAGESISYTAFDTNTSAYKTPVEVKALLYFEKSDEDKVKYRRGGQIVLSLDMMVNTHSIIPSVKDKFVYMNIEYALSEPMYEGNIQKAELGIDAMKVTFNISERQRLLINK